MATADLDRKVLDTFKEFAIDKGLITRLGLSRDDRHIPSYVMDWIVTVLPGDAAEVRDRGLLFLRMEGFRAALGDLERYLALAPSADDAQQIRGHVVELRRSVARLN